MKTSILLALTALTFTEASVKMGVECNFTTGPNEYRGRARKILNNNNINGTIDFIVAFKEMNKDLPTQKYVTKLADANLTYLYPSVIIQSNRELEIFDFNTFANDARHINSLQRYEKTPLVRVATRHFVSRNCMNKPDKLFMYQMSFLSDITGCSHMLFTCHVKRGETVGTYDIEKHVVFMTQGERSFSEEEINTCILSSVLGTTHFPAFPEFDMKGFCICDKLNYYLNDCLWEEKQEEVEQKGMEEKEGEEEKDYKLLGYSVLFGFFILLIFAIETFNRLIESLLDE
jgi:hypothetical protein